MWSSHLKILDTRQVTRSKFHTVDPEILAAIIQNLVAHVTWHSGFVQPSTEVLTWYKLEF
jgi:hypothetical protein